MTTGKNNNTDTGGTAEAEGPLVTKGIPAGPGGGMTEKVGVITGDPAHHPAGRPSRPRDPVRRRRRAWRRRHCTELTSPSSQAEAVCERPSAHR
ncbi:hypothetical protein [Kitasatospora sp. KL5]|uniref:hypothetical protein n=1 Tax=Kitasatospora sp. KL5 TaxID=3425125 RepID=UPI003D6EAD3F